MQMMYLWDSKSCGKKSDFFPIENRKADGVLQQSFLFTSEDSF